MKVTTLKEIRTESSHGPRGEYYDWCRLLSNGTLEFGHEEGNYAGGTTLSYRFYGFNEYSENHPVTEAYWNEAIGVLAYLKQREPEFYQNVIEMCKGYSFTTLNKIEKLIENRKMGVEVGGDQDQYTKLRKDLEEYDESLNELLEASKAVREWLKKTDGAYTSVQITKKGVTAYSNSITLNILEGTDES